MKNQTYPSKKHCIICGKYYRVDARLKARSQTCRQAKCQKALKKRRDAKWRRENKGYWGGRYENTKQWRKAHPEYQRRWRQAKAKSQEQKPAEIQVENSPAKAVKWSFMAPGFGFKAKKGEIQVQIPPGVRLKRVSALTGLGRRACFR